MCNIEVIVQAHIDAFEGRGGAAGYYVVNDIINVYEDGVENANVPPESIIQCPGVPASTVRDRLRFISEGQARAVNTGGAPVRRFPCNLTLTPSEKVTLANLPGVAQDKVNIIFNRLVFNSV